MSFWQLNLRAQHCCDIYFAERAISTDFKVFEAHKTYKNKSKSFVVECACVVCPPHRWLLNVYIKSLIVLKLATQQEFYLKICLFEYFLVCVRTSKVITCAGSTSGAVCIRVRCILSMENTFPCRGI